MLLKTQQLFSK